MILNKVAAFSLNNQGGNPAGVAIVDEMPEAEEMLKIAKDVGYSETAFLHKHQDGWRIRYFAPEMEVPFCGHATIATAFVLGNNHGEGQYKLYLNDGDISVSVTKSGSSHSSDTLNVSLQSPKTSTEPAPAVFVESILTAFGLSQDDVNPDFPIRLAYAGAKHLVIVLKDHGKLKEMHYDFDTVKALMESEGLVTINLLWNASDNTFHSRNPFASGGVYEDPATGAAAAAFAGYLRDINWSGDSFFEIFQGEDMGVASHLLVEYQPEVGSSIKVSGVARYID
ncbi:MAG: PhzF family phenazine biosynthesis protein [Cocleimonas sp.]